MSTHGFESLGDALRRMGISLPSGPLVLDDEPPVGCSRCNDVGWLRRDVPAGHQDFGSRVECSCGLVAQRRVRMVFEQSQVPPMYRHFTLDGYVQRSGKAALIEAIRNAWEIGQRSLLLTGPVGVGKTGIAISLLNERLAAGEGGLYVTAPNLFTMLRGTYGPDERPLGSGASSAAAIHTSEATIMSTLVGSALVVLDDVGMVRLTDWGREKLFTLLNERYGRGLPVIVTTNLGVKDGSLEDHIGSPAFDRLAAMSETFRIDGVSLR
jgi:DNA replication protein DnaC